MYHSYAGWDDLNAMCASCGGHAWMIRRIDYLHAPTSLPGETGMFCIMLTCVPGGILLISMTFQMFGRKGIRLVTLFINVCTWGESLWSVQLVQFDRGGICPICRSVHLCRDRVSTICMISTCLSVGVIDLQDLYNLQDLCLRDLYDLHTGMGYVRSAWYACFYRWVCMICRICMICGIFVWCGGSVKPVYFTLVCIVFIRFASCWAGKDISQVCTWVGSVWSGHLYPVESVWSAGYVWSAGFAWSTWEEYVWTEWSVPLNRDAVCTICKICMIYSISVWSGGSGKAGYFTLVSAGLPTTGSAR